MKKNIYQEAELKSYEGSQINISTVMNIAIKPLVMITTKEHYGCLEDSGRRIWPRKENYQNIYFPAIAIKGDHYK